MLTFPFTTRINVHTMQAMDDRTEDDGRVSWDVAIPLSTFLSEGMIRIATFRDLMSERGWVYE